MRIAILNHGFPPDVGGGETQACLIALKLHDIGYEVHVFTGRPERQLKFPFKVTYLDYFKGFEKAEISPKFFIKELKMALSAVQKFDVLYCLNFSSLQAVGYMRDILLTPIVFTFHCVPVKGHRKVIGLFDDWELEKSYASSIIAASNPSIVVCPSYFFHNWAKEFKVSQDKLKVIYNSVMIDRFTSYVSEEAKRRWRIENNISQDAFLFLTPARMLEKKGLENLVHAAMRAPAHIAFYIVTSDKNADQNFKKKIENFIEHHHLERKIKIVYDKYSVHEMPKLYQMSDALLLPSHHEGLPLTILEAMASKLPILSSDIEALRELIIDGFNAITFKVKNESSLLAQINKVSNLTAAKRNLLISAGFQTVKEKGDIDKNIRELESVFYSCTTPPTANHRPVHLLEDGTSG